MTTKPHIKQRGEGLGQLFSRLFPKAGFEREPSQRLPLDLFVTLWPSFTHFPQFLSDDRVQGIRLNSAMTGLDELDQELESIRKLSPRERNSLYFDVKGRQLRITEVHDNFPVDFQLRLNHPISVNTPTDVLFKAGADEATLVALEEDGHKLVFKTGPRFRLRPGESICIRDSSLRVRGQLFTDVELQKIEKVRKAGFKRYFLSYVESQRDVDQFLELVGRDSEIQLKIESKAGLQYVANSFKKADNLSLVAARGDLYVEVDRPHDILPALKLIAEKDPDAIAASRLLLSVVAEPVPSCSDFCELAWLRDIGYRRMMLCDDLCLKGELLDVAVSAFDEFRTSYAA